MALPHHHERGPRRLRGRRPTWNIDTLEEARTEAEIIQFPQRHRTTIRNEQWRNGRFSSSSSRQPTTCRRSIDWCSLTRVIEGMSVEETADLLGIKPETVKTRLHRARQLVREQLDKQIGPVLMDAFPFAGRRCERMTGRRHERLGLPDESGNLSPRDPSTDCHCSQRPAPLSRPARGDHCHEFKCARAGDGKDRAQPD